ncbi:MAG: alkaline phosphatase D family protein [Paraperlucidibaca sp.]
MHRRQFIGRSVVIGVSLSSMVACGGSASTASQTAIARLSTPEVDRLLMPGQAFEHGVASGDPTANSLILWTAITPISSAVEWVPVTLKYVVSAQRMSEAAALAALSDTTRARRLGAFLAHRARDFTVKIDLGNLAEYADASFSEGQIQALPAGQYIYYQFVAGSQVSRLGRGRTMPLAPVAQARFAVTSCANLPAGFFSVYELINQQDDLDFVLHLGDYLYEYGEGEYGDGSALTRQGIARTPEPATEMLTEQDYVLRHAQYKRDPELQKLHALFAMIPVWDDHEIANDSYREGAENHTEGDEGIYEERKGHAIRAYFNWMPLREQFDRLAESLRPDPREVIYRRLRVGDLLDIVMLDTRIIGRDKQAATPAVDPSRFDENRSLLGDNQRQWLQLQLLEAKNQGARWTFLGQQIMFGQLNLVELPQIQLLGEKALGNLVAVNMDQWDGYVAERNRLRDFIRAIGLENLVVLTGDIHTSWAMELYENPALLIGGGAEQPFGVELVTPSVTSPGFPDGVAEVVSVAVPLANPHIRYNELKSKGFIVVDVTPERMVAEWRYVQSISDELLIGVENRAKRRQFQVLSGTNRLLSSDTGPRPVAATQQLPSQVESMQ